MTELPTLIKRKGLEHKLPDYIIGSQVFKKLGYKTYIERMRDSALVGYEMLQLADCLKYENKNGILDCFDDDKFIAPEWMLAINGDAVLLGCFENEVFYFDDPVKIKPKLIRKFTRHPEGIIYNENTINAIQIFNNSYICNAGYYGVYRWIKHLRG